MTDELLPVLVAQGLSLAHVASVARAAIGHGEIDLPLEVEPSDVGLHALELYAPELDGPLVVLATPTEPAPGSRWRLRVRPLHSAQASELDRFVAAISPDPSPTPTQSVPPEPNLDRWLEDYLAIGSAPPKGPATSEPPAWPAPRGEQLRSFLTASALPTLSLVSISTLPLVPDEPFEEPESEGPRISVRPAPDSSVDPLLSRTLGGRYRIEQVLGEGGMARVYRAIDLVGGRLVAIKVMNAEMTEDPQCVRRFRREFLAHQRIEHPNVLHIHDFAIEGDDLPYLVMEFIAGRDLRRILDEVGTLPMPRIVAIMAQVCGALAEAHLRSVVHRDIKPANIMLERIEGTDEERVVVCDFGLAKAHGEAPKVVWGESSPVTAIGTTVGTPDYLSPEQALGEECDPRTDVYTCGAMMYEMATGRVPFICETLMGHLIAVATRAPAPLSTLVPDIDPAFERVVLKSLSKNRSLRQQSAEQLRLELLALVPDAGRRRTRRWPVR